MDRMPCGLEDDRVRFEPDAEEEEILTPMEKRLEWICGEWQSALEKALREADTYEDWHDIRMMCHGASLAFIECRDRYDDRRAISLIGNIAFEHSIDCIKRGKYEGAPK